MSAGKCKRGPEVLQGAPYSSSSDDDSPRTATDSALTPGSPPALSPPAQPAGHHDSDVSSPSTTVSSGDGPSAVGLLDLAQHSQQAPRRPRVKKKKADVNAAATGDILCSLETTHTKLTAGGQLASSRLAKQQLTPRTKPPRGTRSPLIYLEISRQHFASGGSRHKTGCALVPNTYSPLVAKLLMRPLVPHRQATTPSSGKINAL